MIDYHDTNLSVKRVYSVMEKIYKKNLPILELGDRVGATQYIDFINKSEVTHPVMKGTDCYNRKFIVIKVIVDKKLCIQTFFQRYDDSNQLWMGAIVRGNCYSLLDTCGGMLYSQAELLKDVIEEKQVRLEEKHKPSFYLTDKDLTKNVILYDEKKWNAAELIQYHWKICRYNPKYKICKKIFYKQMNDLQEEHPEMNILFNN